MIIVDSNGIRTASWWFAVRHGVVSLTLGRITVSLSWYWWDPQRWRSWRLTLKSLKRQVLEFGPIRVIQEMR